MINFSARGTGFKLPKNLLNRKPESLLSALSNTDLPIDNLDGCIYVDINPNHIEDIVIFYMTDAVPDMKNDIFLYMDFKYIGLIDNTRTDSPSIPPNMEFPLTYEHHSGYAMTQIEQKYCRIHTVDNHLIIVSLSGFRHDSNDKFLSIIYGLDEDYLVEKSDEFIDIWIGQNKNIVNHILSIHRDGINLYYYCLVKCSSHSSKRIFLDKCETTTEFFIDKDDYDRQFEKTSIDIHTLNCPEHICFYNSCANCEKNYKKFRNSSTSIIHVYNSHNEDEDENEKAKHESRSDVVDQINSMGSTVSLLQEIVNSKYSLGHYEKLVDSLIFLDIYNEDVALQLSQRYREYESYLYGCMHKKWV